LSKSNQRTADAASAYPSHAGFPDMDDHRGYGDGGEWARSFFERMRRGKAIIAGITVLGLLAALLYVWQAAPRYSARALIQVSVPKQNVVDVEDVLQSIRGDRPTIESEIEVIRSRSLAEKAVDKLGLVDNPAYNRQRRAPRRSLLSLLNPLNWIPDRWRAALVGQDASPTAPVSEEERARRARQAAASALLGSVSAKIRGRSRVIALTASAAEPERAAAIANTFADLYLVEQMEMKFEATQRATDWLNTRVEELRKQAEMSELAVEDYRRQHGLIQNNDTTVTEQQISGATNQLIAARAKTAEAEARLRQIRSLLDSGRAESASDVLASPMVQKLREQETDVARQMAEMATVYGARHPDMINIHAELEEVRGKLEAETGKIVRSLENELEVARFRELSLDRDMERLKDDTERINAAQGRLRVLEREAAANRTLFDTFLSRWKETGRQEEIQYADARILSRAIVPSAPSSPKTFQILGATLVFSFVLGIILVYLIDILDSGFRGTEQIEGLTGHGVLSAIPKAADSGDNPMGQLIAKPASTFTESFRTLHTNLKLTAGGGLSKTILIASSIPEEGKTTVAVCLARTLAQAGNRVVLIDADLRRNQVAEVLGLESAAEKDLVSFLTSEDMALSDASQHDEKTGADIIACGSLKPPNSVDLLRSQRAKDLLAACERQYDHVIIDSPPTQLLSDSRVLASMVDQIVFVIRWASTRREIAMNGLNNLAKINAKITGVVLNMVDARKSARYGYYNEAYGYGYGRARHYYARYYTD